MGHLSSQTHPSEQTLAPYPGATSTDGTPMPGDREIHINTCISIHKVADIGQKLPTPSQPSPLQQVCPSPKGYPAAFIISWLCSAFEELPGSPMHTPDPTELFHSISHEGVASLKAVPEPSFQTPKEKKSTDNLVMENHSILEILLSSSRGVAHPSQIVFWDPVITWGRYLSIYKDNTTSLLCHSTAHASDTQCFP